MIKRSIARRYAQALMDLVETNTAEIVGQLVQFHQLVEANPNLKELLLSPAFRLEERKMVFQQLMKRLNCSKPLDRFLWYLIEHRRMEMLGAVVESFVAMVDEREGKVRVQVTSATALTQSDAAKLQKVLADSLNQKVVLDTQVDVALLAGVVVKIGDLVIDGSLRSQLGNLKNQLIQRQS